MTCMSCGHDNRDGARFCSGCGGALEAVCPSCSTINPPGARFCDACGAPLPASPAAPEPRVYTPDHLAARILAERRTVEGERKQVTVLFADVSGSMDLAERTDPEAWRRLMDRFFTRLCDGVHRFEGTVVHFTGDGVMALFGAPIAHEDHAVRAARAALELRRDLAELAAELRREQGLNFSVRIGLNSGEVVVGAVGEDLRVEYTAIGHTVGLAQRMEGLAEPGTAYVTEHTAALLEGWFRLEDLGSFAVKGVREPVHVFELVGPGHAHSRLDVARDRGLSRFVGRRRELAVLEGALDRMLEGHGQVVGVVGEPGVGKSRLCHEFAELCRQRGHTVFEAACHSHARTVPFHAALGMMRGYFGIRDDDASEAARERIAGRLLLLDPELADELPLVLDFLGVPDPERPAPRMDPGARQSRLVAIIKRLTHAHARREPAIDLFEDLHWLDEGSAVFLEALVDAAMASRTLIVVNFRPEYRAPWMASSHYQQLAMAPLGSGATDELLGHLLGDDPSLDGLPVIVREWTGGNPFFIEELVRDLVEDGTLAGERGARRLTRPVASIRVPATVHAVLAARIDRLDERDKAVLQAAAVLGKEFAEPVLARVGGPAGDALRATLRRLCAAEFVVERAVFPEAEYAFRHPLTQEVAYSSLLAERRRAVHAAVAEAIIELYDDRLDERAALLAHHWHAAGRTREAARWHARAAAWAGISDPAAAVGHWRRVRDLAAALEEDAEAAALGLLARAWILQFGWRLGISEDEAASVYDEARALAERSGDRGMLALLMTSQAAILGLSGHADEALALSEVALGHAREADRSIEAGIMTFSAYAYVVSGRFDEALSELDRLIGLCADEPTLGAGLAIGSPLAFAHMMRGFLRGYRGDLHGARDELRLADELAARHGDIETRGWARMNHVGLARWSGATGDALREATASVEIAQAIGAPFSRVWAHFNLGLANRLERRPADAVAAFEHALELIRSARTGVECEPWILSSLSGALAEAGDPAGGRTAAEAAVRLSRERGYGGVLPFALNAAGFVARRGGDAAAAATLLDEALDEARRLGLRSEEALIRLERADVRADLDDTDGELAELREARRLFALNGADGHLTAVEERLAQAAQPA